MLSCEFCEIFKNTFFTEQLRPIASENLYATFQTREAVGCSQMFFKIGVLKNL